MVSFIFTPIQLLMKNTIVFQLYINVLSFPSDVYIGKGIIKNWDEHLAAL